MKRAGGLIAVFDDVSLQIHARHLDLTSQRDGQIVIDGEGKIALTAAEVANADRTVGRKMGIISRTCSRKRLI
jgi:hypothetical protein